MKKIVFFIISFVACWSFVSASDCQYGMPAPPIYFNGSWSYGQTLSYRTAASSCLAANISVYFTMGDYIYNSALGVEAILMEHDEAPNEDDKAKSYYGVNFSGRGFEWEKKDTFDYGNLDSAGDQTCELYMKFRLDDPVMLENNPGYFQQGLFRYSICVD